MNKSDTAAMRLEIGTRAADATVSTCIKSARKALGDGGDTQRSIETVRGRGFRFTADIERDNARANSVTPTAGAAQGVGARPSLLLVPFRAISGDADMARLADGLSSGLGTILTRIPLLRLSNQTARYVDTDITPSARQI